MAETAKLTLSEIAIEGFKSIKCVKVTLGPINVLIGANGSGKSNFIGAFAFLHAIRSGRLQEYVAKAGGANRVMHFGSKQSDSVTLQFWSNDQADLYRIILIPTASDQLSVKLEVGTFGWLLNEENQNAKSINADRSMLKKEIVSMRFVDRWRVHHFHDTGPSSPMKRTADVNDNRFLRPDGSNLAAFLYLLQQKHESSYNLIRRTVQLVAPFFDDFVLEPLALNPDTIRLEWRHKQSDAYFDAASLSDGTLRFIAIATLFLQPEALRPSVILIDEPEIGLHPAAITLLASLVRQASVHTQVILSTQSSTLLDHFDPEDVIVAEQVDGSTQLTRLDAERLSIWLEDYSLGQLWEKNELGGRPVGV